MIEWITFDPAAKNYRMWMYDSAGTEIEWTGTHDSRANTVNWKATLGDGVKLTMNWRFATGGGYTWDFVALSGDKPVFEMKGEHLTRKK
jgi:hypothetical protein